MIGGPFSRVKGRLISVPRRAVRMGVWFLLKRLEHEELFEDLGLTGLPDLSSQEHLIHHRVHLKVWTQEVH